MYLENLNSFMVNHFALEWGGLLEGLIKKSLRTWWRPNPPAETPARPCTTSICVENYIDNVTPAPHLGRHGGAAALLHQDRPVSVRDCQVVVATCGLVLKIKCSEF